jgi:sugar lactone lactonase YvrE
MRLLGFLLLAAFGAQARATAPPAVQYLGVPAPVLTSGISFPIGMAVDASGNLYVAEYSGNAVYKETLQPDGTFVRSTVDSGFAIGPVGLAIDNAGNVYVGLDCEGGSALFKETLQGDGSYVRSSMASAGCTYGISVDSYNNVYATFNDSVVKYHPTGASYTSATIYTGSGMLAGLAIDSSNNLFVASEYTTSLHKLTPSGTVATTNTYSASSITLGAGTSAFDVAVDSSGDLFIADVSGKIRLEIPNGDGTYTEAVLASGLASTYGVTLSQTGIIYFGVSGAIDQFSPAAVNLGSPNLGTASSTSTLIYTIQPGTTIGAINVVSQGVVNAQTGSPEFVNAGGGTCTAQIYSNLTVCSLKLSFTPQFTGLQTGAVQFLDLSGNVLSNVLLYGTGKAPIAGFSQGTAALFSVTGLGATPLSGPRHPVMDIAGNLYIADSGNNRIVKVAPGGAATVLSTPSLTLDNPTAVAIDGAGNLYIADSGNGRVVELSTQGVASVLDTNSLALATNYGVAVDGLGNVYTTDATNNRVLEFPNIGSAHVLSTTGVTLGAAYGVAADGSGNVYVADPSNSRIVKVSNGVGTVLSVGTLSPTLSNPEDVAVDAPGNVYISDTGNNRIVEVSSGVATALSTGSYTLNTPNCAVVGNAEDLYICDSANNRIVSDNQKAPASLTFPSPNSTEAVTLLNLGNLSLALAVPTTGLNPAFGTANFTLPNAGNAGFCPQLSTSSSAANILAGASCNLSVEFSPSGAVSGTVTDTLAITDNNLRVASSTQTISLTGVALSNPTVTLAASPASPITYGQAQTSLGVTVTYTSGTPTGTVSFTDGNTSIGSSITLNGGTASSASQYYLPGTHTFVASYSGDSNFSATTSPAVAYIVNKASSTLSAPSNTVQITHGTAGSIAVSVAGQYSGAGVIAPSGSVAYSITDSSNNEVASGLAAIASGSATVPVASTMTSGLYTVTLTYAGDTNYSASTATTVPLRIGALTPTITWPQPAAITYGASLGSVLNATASNGGAAIAGSFAYTAAATSVTAVTSASILPAGTYTLTATFTPSDANTYSAASQSVTLVVSQAVAAVTLTSSANPVLALSPVTLTASASSTAGVPTGTVTFLDGTTALGTATLSAGVATLTSSSLAVGNHAITAVYAGDTDFLATTSSSLTQSILDFGVNPGTGTGSGSGSGSGDGTTQTVAPGAPATYTLSIVPTAGTVFPTATTLTVTGLPAGASATIPTPSWTQVGDSSWTFPAKTPFTNVTLTIQLPSVTAGLEKHDQPGRKFPPVFLGILLLPFAYKMRRIGKRLGRTISLLMLAIVALSATAALSGCGSANGFFGQQPKTYTVTVTATSGNLSHSTNLTLTVQ